MSVHNKLRFLLAVVPCLLVGMAHAATVVPESEPGTANDPIGSAQPLAAAGGVSVTGYIGNHGDAATDLDFYRFYANAGDVITVDIDNGIGGTADVDTVLAIFDDTSAHTRLRFNDDAPDIDPGSTSRSDARIDNFTAPSTGYYIVGVSNYPRYFLDGGVITSVDNSTPTAGDYTLVITGSTGNGAADAGPPPPVDVPIIVKPRHHGRHGHHERSPVNGRSRGTILVAILSVPGFDPMSVDTSTLTFGSTGDEDSLARCNRAGVDLNGDGNPDLLCHFWTKTADFQPTDGEATVKGKFGPDPQDMADFEGTGALKVLPVKGHHHERHHGRRHSRDHDRH